MKIKVVTPKPFFEISMECGNRKFYETKIKLWNIGEEIDKYQEIREAYVSEKCDYDGDLEQIRIYNCEETKDYINIIKKEFGIKKIIPKGMDLLFTL